MVYSVLLTFASNVRLLANEGEDLGRPRGWPVEYGQDLFRALLDQVLPQRGESGPPLD